MKIEESDVSLQSSRTATETNETEDRRALKVGNRWMSFDELYARAAETPQGTGTDGKRAVPPAPPGADSGHNVPPARATPSLAENHGRETAELLAYRLLLQILDRLTGGNPPRVTLDDWCPQAAASATPAQRERPVAQAAPAAVVSGEFGLRHERYERHSESENTEFSARGVVKTEDGKDISFSLKLSMSREFVQQRSASVEIGKLQVLKDPLVVNFGATAAHLTQAKFAFDLDANGKAEQMSCTGRGSGFLALDLNGDGTINDGRELFGAATGDGFGELARYDQDHNGWIDESDPAFSRLRIWEKDAQGDDTLSTLAAKGIGAIYLGHAASEFSLKDPDNQLQGRIRASGIYLSEDGSVGSVQQVDLAV